MFHINQSFLYPCKRAVKSFFKKTHTVRATVNRPTKFELSLMQYGINSHAYASITVKTAKMNSRYGWTYQNFIVGFFHVRSTFIRY